jgi:5-(carboxyamino)imidazole ribonucleotide mutase
LLAVQILATSNQKLHSQIQQYRQNLSQTVADKQVRLDKLGYQDYLAQM